MPSDRVAAVLGVRHHGPGSARALRAALDRLAPDILLIEGPPEADPLVDLARDPGMEPPVALLAHVPGEPSRAAFWPFAEFSPEWQAIRHALAAGVPVRFCDLPAAHTLAAPAPGVVAPGPGLVPDPGLVPAGVGPDSRSGPDPDSRADPHPDPRREPVTDPVAALAHAAGYDDPERWWDDVVEHRAGATPFDVIAEAMAAVREGHVPGEREARREAHMRRTIRRAARDGHRRIVVVCGAWHVPALTGPASPGADDELLRGLPRVKVEMTWVPWTYDRLSLASGYDAGVASPGWYHHLFASPDSPIERWLTAAAGVLREEGLPVSSAHVIEAVRLARSLAALRDRPLAGLGEMVEAVRAVLAEGDELRVDLIRRRMIVGDRIGAVPDGAPMVPLQRHLRAEQRRLRLAPQAGVRDLDLDLRRPLDLERSRLLHRLAILGVDWGVRGESRGKGTFRESWSLSWRPEFDVRLAEAGALGTTVPAAATARVRELVGAGVATGLGTGLTGGPAGPPAGRPSARPAGAVGPRAGLEELTALVELCLPADLPDALPEVLAALGERAALATDVTRLMAAFPALARAQRYGDVRGTPVEGPALIARSMLDRICAGLPAAVTGLGDEAATALVRHIDAVQTAIPLLEHRDDLARGTGGPARGSARPGGAGPGGAGAGGAGPGGAAEAEQGDADRLGDGGGDDGLDDGGDGGRRRWLAMVASLAGRDDLHGLIDGRLTRILFDAGALDVDQAAVGLARATSAGQRPARVAAWIEGFLAGGGLLLVHDERLLESVDAWLTGLPADAFVEVLPLIRRTFAAFAPAERRSIGSRARALGPPSALTATATATTTGSGAGAGGTRGAGLGEIDVTAAAGAVRTVLTILGRTDG